MKRGKEMTVDIVDNYRVKVGTIDNKNPKAIFFTISSWGKPMINDIIDYDKVIKMVRKQVKQHIYNELDGSIFDKQKTIVDFDMRSSGISFNKKSFMCCEVTLYQLNKSPITSENHKLIITEIVESLIINLLEKNKYFKFYKSK